MAKAYYSTVFEQPAAEVWKIVRDFNNYPVWVGGAGESEIEDGKSGDTVGAVRQCALSGAANPAAAAGAIRRRAVAKLRILRRADAAGDRLIRPPCGSRQLPTATGRSSNGGRLSIANPPGATN